MLATKVLRLLLALLLSQTLGLIHRVAHHPGALSAPPTRAAATLSPATAMPATAHTRHTGLLAWLFPHQDNDATCRLIDQAHGFDVLASVPQVALPMAVTPFLLQFLAGETLARWVALFDARGPPLPR